MTTDGKGVTSRAGTRLVADLADVLGLTEALSEATAPMRQRRSGHDPGRVLRDFTDVYHLARRVGFERMCLLAAAKDPGFALEHLADALTTFERHDPADLRVDADTFVALSRWVAEIRAGLAPSTRRPEHPGPAGSARGSAAVIHSVVGPLPRRAARRWRPAAGPPRHAATRQRATRHVLRASLGVSRSRATMTGGAHRAGPPTPPGVTRRPR